MCTPVNTQADRTTGARAANFAADRIGPCGRRCSECRAAATMTAGLAVTAGRIITAPTLEFVRS